MQKENYNDCTLHEPLQHKELDMDKYNVDEVGHIYYRFLHRNLEYPSSVFDARISSGHFHISPINRSTDHQVHFAPHLPVTGGQRR